MDHGRYPEYMALLRIIGIMGVMEGWWCLGSKEEFIFASVHV
jgi:hypothetical protein